VVCPVVKCEKFTVSKDEIERYVVVNAAMTRRRLPAYHRGIFELLAGPLMT